MVGSVLLSTGTTHKIQESDLCFMTENHFISTCSSKSVQYSFFRNAELYEYLTEQNLS
jgi:hypothetical protein